ncbi:hypothetical protein C8J56DRAFT_928055 [Mycena floridula]|nr:hypothetical protein C8J56DRAFT_928055 [Mycena floridula]
MATHIQGPSTAGIPQKASNRPRNFQHIQPAVQPKADPYYGHERIAKIAACFISHLYDCPDFPASNTSSIVTQSRLPYFIAYALHRTKLHASVTFAALVLLQRLKARFPTARGSSGHRLFISAFMIASKVICDDTYSNKSWAIVAQGMFTLREINQMEREMCSYLDWELTVDNPILSNFEKMVVNDFGGDPSSRGSLPTYSLELVSKRARKAAASSSATPMPDPISTESPPIPSFAQHRRESPTKNIDTSARLQRNSYNSSPITPDTPSPGFGGNSSSPASSASPQTPVGFEDNAAKIHSYDDSPVRRPSSDPLRFDMAKGLPDIHPLKGKMFAYAVPAVW